MKLCLNRTCKPKANDKPLTHEQQLLADNNRGIAYECARKKPILGMDPDENEAEALLCLVRAASRFDPSLGFAFTTFFCAYWNCLRRHANRERQTASKGYDRNQTAYHDDSSKMFDPEDRQPGPDQLVEQKDEIERKLKVLEILDKRSKEVVKRRASGEPLGKIGEDMGLSKQRVQQVHARAMWRLGISAGPRRIKQPGYKEFSEKKKRQSEANRAKWRRRIDDMLRLADSNPQWSSVQLSKATGLCDRICRKYLQRERPQLSASAAQNIKADQ